MDRTSVLIVEDDITVAESIRRILSDAGYRVAGVVSTGEDALRFARERAPSIILLDIELEGGMDGIETSGLIREELSIPVIYITVHAEEDTLQRAKLTQPFGYLHKPVNRGELISAIEVALFKHEAERRVRESEARFRGLVENSPTGILHLDVRGNFMDANPRFFELSGLPTGEDARKINLFAFPPLVDAGVVDTFFQCIGTGKTVSREHPYPMATGEVRQFRYHVNPVRDHRGRITGVLANVEDISETVEARKRIMDEESKFRTIFQFAKDLIILLDPDGVVLDVNERILDLLGHPRENVVGKNILDIGILPRSRLDEFGSIFRGGGEGPTGDVVRDVELRCKDGSEIAAEMGTRYIRKNGLAAGSVNVFRDITEWKRKHEIIQRSVRDRDLFTSASMSLLSPPHSIPLPEHIAETIRSMVLGTGVGDAKNGNTLVAVPGVPDTSTGDAVVGICSRNPDTDTFRTEAVAGGDPTGDAVTTLPWGEPAGMEMPVPDTIRGIMDLARLTRVSDQRPDTTEEGTGKHTVPCLDDLSAAGEIYVMGMVDKGELFGCVWIQLPHGEELRNAEMITTFIHQAAIAIKRSEAEKALRESEESFRTLTALSPVGIFTTDAKGECIYVNQRWTDITGMTLEQARGDGWKDGLHPEDRERICAAWDDLVTNRGAWGREYRFLNAAGGSTWVYGLSAPLMDEKNEVTAFISIHLNITRRKEIELDRERLLSELEDKRQELQQVIYIASHDLRSPMVNVRGFSEELERGVARVEEIIRDLDPPGDVMERLEHIFDQDIRESVQFIGSSITKMDSLINGLLKISRLGTIRITPGPMDMNALLGEIRKTFEFKLKEGSVSLTIHDLPTCYGDRDQINQVFSNLLDNAIKYLDPGRPGKIEISGRVIPGISTPARAVSGDPGSEGEGTVSGEDGDGPDGGQPWDRGGLPGEAEAGWGARVIYSVRDNGIGIPENHLRRVFDIFHRVGYGSAEGDGLGLCVVKRILDRNNGKIWLESEEGVGSVFHVRLPLPPPGSGGGEDVG